MNASLILWSFILAFIAVRTEMNNFSGVLFILFGSVFITYIRLFLIWEVSDVTMDTRKWHSPN